MFPPVVPSVEPYGDPRYVPSYVPSVNPPRDTSEHQVGALQKENWTTLEQVKSLENIIASGEIKVYETAQLQEFYIIKLKCGIFMLKNNVKCFQRKIKLV